MLVDTFFQSALYLPLILGIFLSFKILRLTDLTADGSFVLGAGIYARLLMEGWAQGACVMAGIFGGAIVGLILATIQKNNRVPSILASILCVFMLQSVNISIMGRPNIALLGQDTFLDQMIRVYPLGATIIGWGGLLLLTVGFIKIIQSKIGLIARAFGMNDQLLKKRGYQPELVRKIGLACSNMLYAFSGMLCAQVQKFADISMGMGVSLIGIGAVIMGGQLVWLMQMPHPRDRAAKDSAGDTSGQVSVQDTSSGQNMSARESCGAFKARAEVLGCILGIIGYFLLTRFFLSVGMDPSLIKLFSGMVLMFLFIFNIGQVIHDRNTAR